MIKCLKELFSSSCEECWIRWKWGLNLKIKHFFSSSNEIHHAKRYKHLGRLFLTSTLESIKTEEILKEIWPFSHGSSLLGLFFISSLSVSLFTVSNTVSVISCCHRSDTVKVKFSYNCWSASSNYKQKKTNMNFTFCTSIQIKSCTLKHYYIGNK